jgi:ankyrin repeat protein
MTAGRQLGFIIVALLAASCGSDHVSFDELPVPQRFSGGCNPWTLAAIERGDLSVEKLRARQAVVKCEETKAALWAAIADDDAERVGQLLAAGVDPQGDGSGDGCSTPFGYAFRVRHGRGQNDTILTDTAILKLLIDAGADIEAEWHSYCYYQSWQAHGRPLMVGVGAGDVEFVRLLIDAGADVITLDSEGRTALDIAALGNRPENREAMTALLRDAMMRRGAGAER